MTIGPRMRVLLIAAVVFAALATLVWSLSYRYWSQPVTPLRPPSGDAERMPEPAATTEATTTPPVEATPLAPASEPTPSQPAASPSPANTPAPVASPTTTSNVSPQAQGAAGDAQSALASMHLLIPVQGIASGQLRDTFNDARSEGRVHDAIDIMAARGVPVLASADGRVVRLFQSVKGGTTIYQLASADEHLVFYYAHLERYADGLTEGHLARRGEVIGYVGDTGNAGPGNTHLHFQIYRVADPKHFWTGENINPYPLLRAAQ
ncbi:MAG: peptidoglycan LD-endopeptidase LytH [Acidobacteriota bacterium]|jgi:murein DD-endopeptidase MepM/ murein hydrolase activator NlpD|nr:peptidoglycan LD-endopeptidase LytH [Acidobacteriota bacterium]MDT7810006.1 peptidoglycan LD-endopeptidase LytH [Acidobacteriota bacterium]